MRTSLHLEADLVALTDPLSDPRVDVGPATTVCRNGEILKGLIVEPEIEMALPPVAQQLAGPAPLLLNRNLVFAVHRETVLDGGAAAGADLQIVGHAIVLVEPVRGGVGLIGR